ncbi:polysaccharide biosynthesis tyrosine autokinase [Aquiflexum sp. LQ15W]|uniref:GumC family protein n=1 Tax=Cognataquiflexum nitidum TaxID=2922272 RepID=UPI001F13D6DF|nr:polysaccharide biosynthesis tyrosine autokinase [Cognataquiflexum nitidum]MCH6201731.1 polysaccharide biosynthesis tyrosine autokinase [Cognataquiflexum nitidum]
MKNISQPQINQVIQMEQTEKPFDPIKFLLKVIKFWPLILIFVIMTGSLGFFINKTTAPLYQVQAKFFIKDDFNNLGILNLTGMPKMAGSDMYQKMANEGIFLLSKPIASRALDKLEFSVDYFNIGTFVNTELYKSSPIRVEVDWNHPQLTGGQIGIIWENKTQFKLYFPDEVYTKFLDGSSGEEISVQKTLNDVFSFGETVELPFLKLKVILVNNTEQGEILIAVKPKSFLISKYTGEDLQVFPVHQMSSVLGLSLNTSHPQKGADYLNALMEVYLEIELEEKNRLARNTVDFIDSQISGVSDTLSYYETNLQNFRSVNKTINLSEESSTYFQEITNLEKELSQEKFNKDYFDNLREYLVRGNYEQILAPAGLGIQDLTLNSLIADLVKQQSERNNLLNTQTEASPRVKEITRKIDDTKSSLFEVIRNLSSKSQFMISDLEARIGKIERQFTRLPSTEQNLLKIERGKNLNEAIYNYLQQRRAESAISMASNFASNKIVEYAIPNYSPITTRKTAIYLISIAMGFILPVLAILIILLFDNKIKDSKELEVDLQVPLIGKIPKSKNNITLSVLNEPRSAVAESFRSIKTNIGFIVPYDKQLTIAVSSTISGEGKSFTAINLASIYSLNKKKTILVSCDMFKPNAMQGFDLASKIGLSNYLSHQVDSVFDIIQSTKHSNLDVIYAGVIPPNPSDLLASPRFAALVEQLKGIYDVIVLDTPPVGLISQSLEVTKHVDLITFVFRYNLSERSYIEDLNSLKMKNGIHHIYAILNDVPSRELTYKGMDYGYYEEASPKNSKNKKAIVEEKVTT